MAIDVPAQLAYHDAMWHDFADEPVPECLAHYTSLATLEKILRSNEIWLSNPLYMNDREELHFGMTEGAMAFQTSSRLREACGDDASHRRLQHHFTRVFNGFIETQALDAYVFCLASHDLQNSDGVLSMWRGYGAQGAGAALLIRTASFPKFENVPITFGRVLYGTAAQRRKWLANKLDSLASAIAKHDKTDENLEGAVRHWFERMKLFSLFTKHEGFSEEREWRAVYIRERDQGGLLAPHLSYAITDRGVEPKLRLSLSYFEESEQDGFANVLAGVLLGPSHSTSISQAAARRMLELVKHPHLAERVVASTIPFRRA